MAGLRKERKNVWKKEKIIVWVLEKNKDFEGGKTDINRNRKV